MKGGRRAPGRILVAVPAAVDPKALYLFYLHGLIIENGAPRPTSPRRGVYEYREILEHFRGEGFTVISEARPKRTGPEDLPPFERVDGPRHRVGPEVMTAAGATLRRKAGCA